MTCPRESEIVDVLMTGRWPDACDGELRAHAASCAICADLVLVATAIAADTPVASVPTSGVVWWRIQRREREVAARTASRTITIVQASSIAGAIALALTILGGISAMDGTWSSWLQHINDVPLWALLMWLAVGGSLALAPVALYWAWRED